MFEVSPFGPGRLITMLEGPAAQWSCKRLERTSPGDFRESAFEVPMVDLVRAIDEGLRGHVSLLTQAMESASFPRRRGETVLRRPLDRISQECRQLTEALDDVREIGRLVEGGVPTDREVVPFSEILDQSLELARPAMDDRRVRAIRRFPSVIQWIEVHRPRFVRTLAGLIERVVERADVGSEVFLRGFADGVGHSLIVQVEPVEECPEEQTRSRPPDLELILARCLVRGLGGHFSLGRSLRLWLPRSAQVEERPNRAEILIIDRSREAAKSLGHLLTNVGCRVRTCAGLVEAASALASRRPDVLLFDLELAAELGVAADNWVAKTSSRGVPPIVLGLGDPADRYDLPSGFRDILTRPIQLEQLRRFLDATRPQSASA